MGKFFMFYLAMFKQIQKDEEIFNMNKYCNEKSKFRKLVRKSFFKRLLQSKKNLV